MEIILSRSILWITICILLHERNYLDLMLYVFCHDVSNALFLHVTSHCRKFIILGKAGSFSQKQVLTCLVKTGNDSAIFQGHDSRMISIDQLKTSP